MQPTPTRSDIEAIASSGAVFGAHDLERLRILSRIVEQVGEAVAVVDNEATIVYANAEFARMHRCDLEQLRGQGYRGSDFFTAEDWQGPVQELMRNAMAESIGRAEITRRRSDGTSFAAHVTLSLLRDEAGELVGRVLCIQDMTARSAAKAALVDANARLEQLATTDQLTGLPNRAVFLDRLDQAMALAGREPHGLAVLFIDIDRFKTVNDSLGHHCGDQVLIEVARRLQGALGASDSVARLSGDGFAVLMAGRTSPEAAAAAAGRILASLRPPFVSGATEFFVSASIGVAVWPEDCRSQAELLQHADVAMYRAKATGGNRFEMFQPAMTVAAHERLTLEADLRRAVDSDGFFLRYQPQIELATGRVTGVEALLRWDHPSLGEVLPGRFIPLAEETALIVPIGTWVMAEACQQAARWRAELDLPLGMAVNVSPLQLAQPDFLALVMDALSDAGLPPSALELEITETILIDDAAPAITALRTLRDRGVYLAIDDFGTGYSSLSSLRRFLVDRLKLDMSLISGLSKNDASARQGHGALVAAAINIAHALGLETVAEGVTNQRQVRILAGFGCEQAQGYFWSEPLLAPDLSNWLTARSTA